MKIRQLFLNRRELTTTAILLAVSIVGLILSRGFAPHDVVGKENMNIGDPFKYSVIDTSGSTVIDLSEFQEAGTFSHGLAPVFLVGKGWGFIDKRGQVVIPLQFNEARGFSEGLAPVQINGKWGFINTAGRVVIEPRYEYVNSFSEGLAVVVKPPNGPEERPSVQTLPGAADLVVRKSPMRRIDSTGGSRATSVQPDIIIIDSTGRIIGSFETHAIELRVYDMARFSEGLIDAVDSKSGKAGFIDKTGRFVIPPQFDEASSFSEGLARVAVSEGGQEKVGYINRNGRFQIPAKFNTDGDFRNSTDFSEGWAAITENLQPTITEKEKFSYIDRNGRIALRTDYFLAGPFRDGLAAVYDQKTNLWGFIRKSGKIAIPIKYAAASSFSDGLAVVAITRN